MVNLVFLCRRRPDIARERYRQLLLGDHAPLALAHHQTMRRYVVNIVEDAPGGSPALDSIGELGFRTLGDFHERLYDSPAGERLIARDVARFLGGADAYATRAHVLRARVPPERLGERSAGTKLFVCLRRPPGASPETFVRDWLEGHLQPLLDASAVQASVAHVVDERLGPAAPDYAGIVALWLEGDASAALNDLCVPAVGACYRVGEYVQRW